MNATRILSLRFVLLWALTLLAACQSLPTNSAMLEKARSDYRAAEANPTVRELAKVEWRQASDALYEADRAWGARNEDADEIEHMAYMAKQRVAIAQETAVKVGAEQAVAAASKLRERIRLDARTAEADAARLDSQASHHHPGVFSGQTEASPGQPENVRARDVELEARLRKLNAKTSDRGVSITLGDMLFDTGRSQLKAGGLRSVDKLVDFLNRYPLRKAIVEGFTDSTGSEASNEGLSGRRAATVRGALLQCGVGGERVAAFGYGEAFPVGTNGTAAGRQSNRRVEIILSDSEGNVVAR